MQKRLPLILLAAAIGCTQAGGPDPVPDVTAETSETSSPAAEASLQLPDASATLVQFYSPGMT